MWINESHERYIPKAVPLYILFVMMCIRMHDFHFQGFTIYINNCGRNFKYFAKFKEISPDDKKMCVFTCISKLHVYEILNIIIKFF